MKEEKLLSGWRLTLARVLVLLAVLGITVAAFALRDRAQALGAYGYPGIFLISIIANSTVILPVPAFALTYTMGAIFNPLGVALASAAGAAIGELTGYIAGLSGEGLIAHGKTYQRYQEWTSRFGGWTIMFLAAIPNPLFDVAGMAAGALRMRVTHFLFFTFLGKAFKMLLISYAGLFSAEWLLGFFE
jgi:uncharacterized membrane protein YdjX (TVP38/TMEM64 family)